MIGQYFDIDVYNWKVYVYYEVNKNDIPFCITRLKDLTIKKSVIDECKETILSGKYNKAFIYSSYIKKESIIFITHPSSTGEFLNTITHEANHLKSHIASYYNLDEKDEEVCYIIGDIVQQMSETFMRFIYSKCLKIKN